MKIQRRRQTIEPTQLARSVAMGAGAVKQHQLQQSGRWGVLPEYSQRIADRMQQPTSIPGCVRVWLLPGDWLDNIGMRVRDYPSWLPIDSCSARWHLLRKLVITFDFVGIRESCFAAIAQSSLELRVPSAAEIRADDASRSAWLARLLMLASIKALAFDQPSIVRRCEWVAIEFQRLRGLLGLQPGIGDYGRAISRLCQEAHSNVNRQSPAMMHPDQLPTEFAAGFVPYHEAPKEAGFDFRGTGGK